MLKVCIMTPEKVFLDVETDELILPTNTGQIGILENHSPILTGLDIGIMLIREGDPTSNSSKWNSIGLLGGFALVKENKIIILVNEALEKSTLDLAKVKESLEKTEEALKNPTDLSAKEKIRLNLALKKERVKFQLLNP
jgi:ATP synthase F1 epsilon subunit